MSTKNTKEDKEYVAKMSLAYYLDIPAEAITDVLLVDQPEGAIQRQSYVIFKTMEQPQGDKIANLSKHLHRSLGLTAKQEADGIYLSGLGKTSQEILSLLGETQDIFEALGEMERNTGWNR
jgi:hypothetical protein